MFDRASVTGGVGAWDHVGGEFVGNGGRRVGPMGLRPSRTDDYLLSFHTGYFKGWTDACLMARVSSTDRGKWIPIWEGQHALPLRLIDPRASLIEIPRLLLNSDEAATQLDGCDAKCAGAHEWIGDDIGVDPGDRTARNR